MRLKVAAMSAHFRSLAVFLAGVFVGTFVRRAPKAGDKSTLQRSVSNTADALKLAEEQRNARRQSDR